VKCDGHCLFQNKQREAKRPTDLTTGPFPRRGTPRPPVQNSSALAGLPACGAGFCPTIPAFPIPGDQWLRRSLRSRSRGRLHFEPKSCRFGPYRIPSSPVIGQEPTPGHHLPPAASCQAEGPGPMTPEPDIQIAEETDARHAQKMAKKKVARDKIMATKSGEKGLIIVHT